MDAMIDLTGGLAERYDIEDTPNQKKLFRYLSKAAKTGAFITASRKVIFILSYDFYINFGILRAIGGERITRTCKD